ncbi:GNAT family N-acetyltransferase [Crossiella sp. SN42]|uniref:GNAT family N-acetyltransferase n=1 Tax=Crossiella sp. SN42 TaxID=2944808 RepID=UPI00207CD28D|nr:GNAT family N-acetyltransferase [Crossiella sp. SN42]MCO1576830.1 GNAT family N-acetyltransferase [Crossiella sp. SN42]
MDQLASPLRLTGHGLVLREWEDTDHQAMIEVLDSPEVARNTPVPFPFDPVEYLAMIRRTRAEDNRLHLAITTDGETPLGLAFLAPARAEAGYVIGRAHRGQGLAVRTTRLLTEFGHHTLGLPELRLRIRTDNAPSQGVARAAGYQLVEGEPERLERGGEVAFLEVWRHRSD